MKKYPLFLLACLLTLNLWSIFAQAPTPHGISVSWTASSGAAGYVLFRCPGTCTAASNWTAVTTGTILGTNYLDPASGLAVNTTYSYEADAVDSSGNYSGPSNIATVTVGAAWPSNPPAPTGCNAKIQ